MEYEDDCWFCKFGSGNTCSCSTNCGASGCQGK